MTASPPVLLDTHLPHLFYRGKVRDIYDLGRWLPADAGPPLLLMVATDRISAFDAVLPTGIPHKGGVLTQLSAFWFQRTAHLMPNHFVALVDRDWLAARAEALSAAGLSPRKLGLLAGRAMVARRAERIEVECVVRGYLAGSAWEEYRKRGSVSGQALPPGLRESQRLPQPLFTPTTKADSGHDQPITPAELVGLVGEATAHALEAKSLGLYAYAHEYALKQGIIIADTKLEFGRIGGEMAVIDELLTPDSSRFWEAAAYAPGRSQPSYDKQPVRDWLVASGWDREPPAPPLPPEVVAQTSARYREVYRRLTGQGLG
ncbi:MAG: phosphoribosylaminoimidazolesuccinocarboxamide synthase [Chloroflexi bacterium]|nr:phosphoribosylaminoimidazolesuccinocarboxamide synthase [Chloroflexota bacterium]